MFVVELSYLLPSSMESGPISCENYIHYFFQIKEPTCNCEILCLFALAVYNQGLHKELPVLSRVGNLGLNIKFLISPTGLVL